MEHKGTITALITPFKDNKLDVDGLRENIENQMKSGVEGILVLGTTGESPTLTLQEKDVVVKTAVELAKGKMLVMVGTGTNATDSTVSYTKHVKELGADSALVVCPYYNKPTQEGIFRHFKAVSSEAQLPIIVYNIGSRTGKNIETDTLERIATLPYICGVKEASGNLQQIEDVITKIVSKRSDFSVLCGNDDQTLAVLSLGGHGVISVISNLIPKEFSELVQLGLNKNWELATEKNNKLQSLMKALSLETNPIPIKTAMNLSGYSAGGLRLPLCEMAEDNVQILRSVLNEVLSLKLV